MNGVTASRCGLRYLLIGFGWFNVALGAIGVVVPGMPTTVFLLIALWAFSKSSERFRTWLYEHVYGYAEERDSNVIEVYVRRLRDKLGAGVIETRRGQGYLFRGTAR